MGLIQATIETLASVLGCRQDQAEDVVHSHASARAAMSRRGFFMAAGAVAAGVVMLDAAPAEAAVDPLAGYTYNIRAYAGGIVDMTGGQWRILGMEPTPEQLRIADVVRQRKGVYMASFPTTKASGYIFMSGDHVFRTHPGETDYRFVDDTQELVCRK